MEELQGPPPPKPVKRGARADALDRADRCWTARVAGATWAQAAQVAGFNSDTHAIEAVKSIFGTLPKLTRDELRNLWRDRLERSWRQVCLDMADRVPGATTASVRIATAAITLDGLAEPVKVDLNVNEVYDGFLKELSDAGYLGT